MCVVFRKYILYIIIKIPQQEASVDERTIAAIENLRPKLQVTFLTYLLISVPNVVN